MTTTISRQGDAEASAAERERNQQRIGQLMLERRWCYYIPVDGFVEGFGFRVSYVIEGEPGHYPNGDLRACKGDYSHGAKLPWFWGMTLPEAKGVCKEANFRMGVTERDAADIVTSSIVAQHREGKSPMSLKERREANVCSECDGPIDENDECRC